MNEQDELRREYEESYQAHLATFPLVEGAASLIKLYGGVPSFHDAEITDLHLRAKGGSTIRVSNLYPTIFDAGHVFVTFEVGRLIDVRLDGFNHGQNVLYSLHVRPARHDPARHPYWSPLEPGDLEIALEDTVGLGGLLVCREVKISWTMDRRARQAKGRPELSGQ